MATERLPMRYIREILRLKWTLKRSHRDTARSLGISPGAVASVMSRATALGLTWAALDDLTDEALEQRLYGPTVTGRPARPLPDPAWIHTELRRTGVTLELLHLEYLGQHPDGYRYSAFCLHYRQWVDRQRLSMRQVHTAGEKLFVDYSGSTTGRSPSIGATKRGISSVRRLRAKLQPAAGAQGQIRSRELVPRERQYWPGIIGKARVAPADGKTRTYTS